MTDTPNQNDTDRTRTDAQPIIDDRDESFIESPGDDIDYERLKRLLDAVPQEMINAGNDTDEHDVKAVYRLTDYVDLSTQKDDPLVEHGALAMGSDPMFAHYICRDCGLEFNSEIVAFIHARADAPDILDRIPPAIKTDTDSIAEIDTFSD